MFSPVHKLPVLLRSLALCCGFVMMAAVAATEDNFDFSLKDMDGKVHTPSDYQGKWIIVNFWATSCPPCIEEMPELSAFHDRHKDRDAAVLGVNFESIEAKWAQRFLDSVVVTYPNALWGTSPATPFGMVFALPTTFIITPEGKLVARQVGPMTAADIEAYIKRKSSSIQTEKPATEKEAQVQ
jgi:thiol-disulfide isomerase/thioredoxin